MIYKFHDFIDDRLITEALNTPVEFYMTDDTKLPTQIYTAFEINGTEYGASLVLTKYDRIYEMEFYRIVNKYRKPWNFLKAGDIRPGLSTLIKFIEASIPFLFMRMDGIILKFPTANKKFVKYQTFLRKVLKRSHFKKYRDIPFNKISDKGDNFIFISKMGRDPSQLFNATAFKKNYSFVDNPNLSPKDNEKALIADVIMDSKPKLIQKKIVSTKPSVKYAFGVNKIQITADEETLNMIEAAVKEHKEQQIQNVNNVMEKYKKLSVDKISNDKLDINDENSILYYLFDALDKSKEMRDMLSELMVKLSEEKANGLSQKVWEIEGDIKKLFKEYPKTFFRFNYDEDVFTKLDLALYYLSAKTTVQIAEMYNKREYSGETYKKFVNKMIDRKVELEKAAKENKLEIPNIEQIGVVSPKSIGTFIAAFFPDDYRFALKNPSATLGDFPSFRSSSKYDDAPITKFYKKVTNLLNTNGLNNDDMTNFLAVLTDEKAGILLNSIQHVKKEWINDLEESINQLTYLKTGFKSERLTLNLPFQPISPIESFQGDNENDLIYQNNGRYTWGYASDDPWAKKKYILYGENMKYMEQMKNSKNLGSVKMYTESYSTETNKVLRNAVKNGKIDSSFDGNKMPKGYNRAIRMTNFMESLKPTPEAMWVYRSGKDPRALEYTLEDDIIDPGFMSCSIRSDMQFGDSSPNPRKIEFKIYVPKGSLIIPVLDLSNHSGESEIILPPMSIIKPIDIIRKPARMYVKGIYVGTAYKDFLKRVKQKAPLKEEEPELTEGYETMTEEKNKTLQKEREERWEKLGELDLEKSRQIQDMIKRGELNVDRNESKGD